MILVPYYHAVPDLLPRGACVHLGDAPTLPPGDDVWLESYDPRATLAAARSIRRPVLNSLSLDETAWEAYGSKLHRFWRVVLLPYRPGAERQNYDAQLEAILQQADRYGIERERRIVDVCILPMRVLPDASSYIHRITRLAELGLSSCGGVNNYVHNAPETLLSDFWRQLSEAGMTYGIVSAPLATKYGLALL